MMNMKIWLPLCVALAVSMPLHAVRAHDAKHAEFAQLAERIAIQDVLSAYSAAVTRHDFAAIGPLFTSDATWEVIGAPQKFSFKGAEIGPGIEGAIKVAADLVQINAPAMIEVKGDTATAHSVVHEYGDMADRSARAEATGTYQDVLRKVDGKWKFQSRVFTMRQLWFFPYPPKAEAKAK